MRGWLSLTAWKQTWRRLWRGKEFALDFSAAQEQELAALFLRTAERSAKEWQCLRPTYEEARLGSWIRALEAHVAFCKTFGNGGDDTVDKVAVMLQQSKRKLREVEVHRMMRIAKQKWRKKKRLRAVRKVWLGAVEAPEAPKEAPKEEEKFELNPNLAEELKRWGEFKTGPGATSDQKGIDELTAFVAKRQAQTEPAASKERSFHNEQMTFGPLPTDVGANGAAK